MKRVILFFVLLALPLLAAPEAGATRECDGLDVCISVPGPWVALPAAPRGGLRTVHYQLTCPRGSIVGGLDAVLGDRTIDVQFLGALGSPVNPGISTERRVVFVATYAGGQATTFRPLIGCIPTSGGGGRGTTAFDPAAQGLQTAAVAAAAQRPQPPIRRVRTLRVPAGSPRSLAVGCRAGERLVGSSHAVAFRVPRRPAAPVLTGASAARRQQAGRVVVQARRSAAVPAGTRVEVQVHAICARDGG